MKNTKAAYRPKSRQELEQIAALRLATARARATHDLPAPRTVAKWAKDLAAELYVKKRS